MIVLIISGLIAGTVSSFAASGLSRPGSSVKPTVVLVHGAFAESSSWNKVVVKLLKKGYPVVAVAIPLRCLKSDSDYVAALFKSIRGPVVAVGHSYGGLVISDAAAGNPNVEALVYVAAFAPEPGESAADLAGRFPGGTLGPTLAAPVDLPDGGEDLYIQQDKYHSQFAADVPEAEANVMAVTQRPIEISALHEPARSATWQTIPSWFIFGSLDKNIPEAAHFFMAKRAKAKEIIEIKGGSHVVMVSHPDAVAELIEHAATSH
jgi:pimeloyl-ACP methyl ester carboxylesterase